MFLPSILSYGELQSFFTKLQQPMRFSLQLDFCPINYRHVIGISHYTFSETTEVEYHIIDGARHEMKAIYFNQENIDLCRGTGLPSQISHIVLFLFQG
jgi:hypothetical protein